MKIRFPVVYPITDTALSGLTLPQQVEQMIAGGAEVIQLRDKKASSRDFYEAASAAVRLARPHNVRIIVNDRVDIALLLEADGVHLGQEDLSPVHARGLLGEKAVIGYSTHNLSQASEAMKLPIDYLALGPTFQTSTKEDPDPATGLDMLAEAKKLAGGLPLVAIGGIDEDSIRSVLDAGADSAAMIGSIVAGNSGIAAKLRSLLSIALNR